MRSFTYLVLAAICLSTIGIFTKLIGGVVPIIAISFLRVFLAFIFLAVFSLAFNRKTFRTKKKNLLEYFWVGCIIALSFSLYIGANVYAPIQNAVLLSYTSPFFVLIAARFILKEKVTKSKILSMMIAFIGLLIISPFSVGNHFLGNSMSLLNAVFFALFITLIRKEEVQHDISNMMWFMFFASLVLLPFAIYYGFGDVLSVWWQILLLGFVSTGFAYLLLNLAMRVLEAEITAISAMVLVPLFAILLAYFVLQENLNIRILIGGSILIFAGFFLEVGNDKKLKKHLRFLH